MNKFDLTEEEKSAIIEKALMDAQQRKKEMYEAEQKRIQEEEYAKRMRTPFTPEQYLTLIHYRSKEVYKEDLVIDSENEQVVKDLCLYFANDKRFEKNGRKLNKGILMMGDIGAGKTYLLKLFAINQRRCYRPWTVFKICDQYEDFGNEIIIEYSNPEFYVSSSVANFFQNEYGRLFDDLGNENISRNEFGGREQVMRKIISTIYDRSIPYFWFHMTSNLTKEQIGKVYGERVLSRLYEMYNFLYLKGKDRRKHEHSDTTES